MEPQKPINPIDQDLDRLETEIRRLKVEYDIFFNGGTAKPPMDTKGRVEAMIKRIFDLKGMSFGQRFRYNNLVARYNVMRELWRRQQQKREENGVLPTVEAVAAVKSINVAIRCRDPKREPEKVSELYDYLLAAKRECGERINGLKFDTFQNFIFTRSDQIKQTLKTEAVDFIVVVENGKVKFTARAVKDPSKAPERKVGRLTTGALTHPHNRD
ncbi:MAG: MXAN_5187 C-terminal domain-containing protein [Acidobacteriota bacterium]